MLIVARLWVLGRLFASRVLFPFHWLRTVPALSYSQINVRLGLPMGPGPPLPATRFTAGSLFHRCGILNFMTFMSRNGPYTGGIRSCWTSPVSLLDVRNVHIGRHTFSAGNPIFTKPSKDTSVANDY